MVGFWLRYGYILCDFMPGVCGFNAFISWKVCLHSLYLLLLICTFIYSVIYSMIFTDSVGVSILKVLVLIYEY